MFLYLGYFPHKWWVLILLNRASDDSYKMLKCLNIGSFGCPVSMCLFWQWTRSTTWRLQPLLPTTCTIQLKHWRPTPSALLTCLVSAHSHSCWVEIWIWIWTFNLFFNFFWWLFPNPCVCSKVWPSVWGLDCCWLLLQRFMGVREPNHLWVLPPTPTPDDHIEFSHQSGCCLMVSFGNLISAGTIVFSSLWVSL